MHRTSIRPITKGKSLVVALLLLGIVVNFLITWIAGSRLASLGGPSSALVAKKEKVKPRQKTMAPQESSQTTAGFIHVGKTGGSTISKLLRNGCTSFVTGPCRNITNESIVSNKVVGHQKAARYPTCCCLCCSQLYFFLFHRSTTIMFQTFTDYRLPTMDLSSFQFVMSLSEPSPPSSITIPEMLLPAMSSSTKGTRNMDLWRTAALIHWTTLPHL